MNNINIINSNIVLPVDDECVYGINDIFALSSSENMDIYSNVYSDFHRLIEQYRLGPEGILTFYLEENGFFIYPELKNINLIDRSSYIVRVDGGVVYLWNGYRVEKNKKKVCL